MARGFAREMNRDRILSRFEVWLDEALAGEEPPEGIAAEILAELDSGMARDADHGADLYSMQAALTALTQEIKLQSRSFKQLSETIASPLAPPAMPVPEETPRAAERRARREMLHVLLDLRDRLRRGLRSAQDARGRMELQPSGWKNRLLSRLAGDAQSGIAAGEALMALEKGYELSTQRLDEALDRFRVSEIEAEGQQFDSSTMSAVDLEETYDALEGTVLEVYRPGYEWEGEVFRVAEVKVARAPRGSAANHDHGEG